MYASLVTPLWLRLLGAQVGKDVEASTVVLLPSVTTIEDGAFLADDTMVASYDLHNGWLRIGRVTIGKRAFLGNSGLAGGGHSVPKDGLVAVLSVTPLKSKPGSSWLGSPAVRLRRLAVTGDLERTYRPTLALRWWRAIWEACRLLAVVTTCAIGLWVLLTLAWLDERVGLFWTALLSGVVLVVAGVLAAAISTAVKWIVVGPIRAGEHPLWSSFVWRTEVSDTFTEMVAGPVVRERQRRHARAGPVAAQPRREDRARRVVRHLLAARTRPGHPRRRRHRQPGLRCADPPVP